jgi:hypothetical protein
MMKSPLGCFLLSILTILACPALKGGAGLEGDWKMLPEKSSEIGLYRTVDLHIEQTGGRVIVVQQWGGARGFRDSLSLPLDGSVVRIPVNDRIWPTNVFMGVAMQPGTQREVHASSSGPGALRITERYPLHVSQGVVQVPVENQFTLSADSTTLTWRVVRPSRPAAAAPTYTFVRANIHAAYVMRMSDNWAIDGKLPEQAFLISLQGVANTGGPRLYFIYGEKWDFTFTQSVFDYYKSKHHYAFTELRTPDSALAALRTFVKGYVVWDKNVRTSLIVAFTVAGLEKAVVVSEEMIPMVERAGLRPVADFRGTFTGKKDAEIYRWAMDQYWDRCSRDFVVWLGGESGKIMKPGVADFGMLKGAFFTDLSTKPDDTEEYALARKIFGEMKPLSLVMGWHSYAKDKERDHVKLASSFGLRVEGLHTLPNMSFCSQTALSPGFRFTNNHHLTPGAKPVPGKKVYIAAIETDCLGIGSWLKPGRGDIPYAWEVTMNWVWLAPTMLEYFYGMATPNDYFIGSLGGPGYMYPKAIPPVLLPQVVEKAHDLMKQLDLNVFEIMDYSEGATVEGNSEVTRSVMDAFYQGMPDAIGFVNGYTASYSFTSRNGRPLVSFDYYLSETRPEAEAVADLQELAALNSARPYFLLMHVRQWTDIKRVKNILDKLGPEFEIVPLDIFLAMAGAQPTFKEHLIER